MLNRRMFLGAAAASAAAPVVPALAADTFPTLRGRIVILGGGFAGATCAKYLRAVAPRVSIILVEPNATYTTCPFSNETVVGLRALDRLQVNYDALRTVHQVSVKRNTATAIDPANRSVLLANGATLTYDRLIVAPGIEFDFAAIEGHSATLADTVLPHAWKAGSQTTRLQALLRNMKPGGTFVLSVPPAPYRCPPAPYERASLVAWWLKLNNPTAKVMILDGNDSMPKQPLFEEAWNTLTPGMITRITKTSGGTVRKVDAARHIVSADAGSFKAHVANLIVPHRAPAFARSAGLADATGWCPVDPRSFESRLVPGIHVIGDAASCGLPKSATSGMAEAKVCATAVAAMMAGEAPGDPMFINTCYSVVQPDYAFGLAGVYRLQKDPTTGRESIVAVTGASGTSPTGQNLDYRKKEAEDAEGWYRNMVADAFA